MSRPIHLRGSLILLVGLGGALGTLARYLVSLAIPTAWQLPWPTLTVNLVGAFLLGALLEGVSRRGADGGRIRVVRLLVGTGFMGGFTTYSSLAVETLLLLRDDRVWEGVGYGLITVVLGLLASFCGIWAAAARHRAVMRRTPGGGRAGAGAQS